MKYFAVSAKASLLISSASDSSTLTFLYIVLDIDGRTQSVRLGTESRQHHVVRNQQVTITRDDQQEHKTPILWQAKGIAEARFTSRPEWNTAGESMWTRLSKSSAPLKTEWVNGLIGHAH